MYEHVTILKNDIKPSTGKTGRLRSRKH